MVEQSRERMPHCVIIEDRSKMKLSGVLEVESFDEETVHLQTECGALVIQGTNMHIEGLQLETGDLVLTGKLNSFTYSDRSSNRSFLGKLFR
jgi:sporulation protein YabP